MITQIFGLPKSGKTGLLAKFAIERMYDPFAWDKHALSKDIVDRYNGGGFSYTLPEEHLVYADFDIRGMHPKMPARFNHYTNGFRVAFGTASFEVDFFPPYSSIFLSEAQTYYDCHKKEPCDEVSVWYQRHGHAHIDVFLDCQRWDGLHRNIRNLVQQFIEIRSMRVGRSIIGKPVTVWHTRVYDGINALEKHFTTSDKVKHYKNETFVFNGNIWDCYNGFCCEPQFFDGHYCRDFSRGGVGDYRGKSVDEVLKFNSQRTISAPEGFYSNAKGGR